jgi:hypothetical protein
LSLDLAYLQITLLLSFTIVLIAQDLDVPIILDCIDFLTLHSQFCLNRSWFLSRRKEQSAKAFSAVLYNLVMRSLLGVFRIPFSKSASIVFRNEIITSEVFNVIKWESGG